MWKAWLCGGPSIAKFDPIPTTPARALHDDDRISELEAAVDRATAANEELTEAVNAAEAKVLLLQLENTKLGEEDRLTQESADQEENKKQQGGQKK